MKQRIARPKDVRVPPTADLFGRCLVVRRRLEIELGQVPDDPRLLTAELLPEMELHESKILASAPQPVENAAGAEGRKRGLQSQIDQVTLHRCGSAPLGASRRRRLQRWRGCASA